MFSFSFYINTMLQFIRHCTLTGTLDRHRITRQSTLGILGRLGHPRRLAANEFLLRDVQRQFARLGVHRDLITVVDKRDRTARLRFRANVANNEAL